MGKKISVSVIIRGGEITKSKRYSVTALQDNTTLHFGVLAERFMMWKKVIASKIYCSDHNGAVIATYSYQAGNILAVIASKSYCSDSQAKAITCNAVTF